MSLANDGRLADAEEALGIACDLFRPDQLPVEHAKALNARGAVQRLSGQLDAAADSFSRAASLFDGSGLPLEQGAAMFNMGLVERQRESAGAIPAFEQAQRLLDPRRVPSQAAAAGRELGAALFAAGRFQEAVAPLESAVALAAEVADRSAMGSAANILGLAHLAAGRPGAAVEALEEAVSAHPRSLRPAAFAMAKANLALAREAAGQPHLARLAALQALATPEAAPAVVSQASAVVERYGRGPGAVWAVLDDLPVERWPRVLREEIGRWVDLGAEAQREESKAWLGGQLARPAAADSLAESFLSALVELPPRAMTQIVRSVLEALCELEGPGRGEFAAQCSRAMARFPVPQFLRVKDMFSTAAAEVGLSDIAW